MTLARTAVLCAVVCASFASPARAKPADEAAVLVQQGQRLERDGRVELAAELYRAALLLVPSDPEAHRLLGANLHKQNKCGEAIPAFRAYIELAPVASRSGAKWEDAVLNLATCLRSQQARLEVSSAVAAKCAADGGLARDVGPSTPVVFELAPGEHRLVCDRAGLAPFETPIALAPREQRRLAIDPPAAATATAPATPAIAPAAAGPTPAIAPAAASPRPAPPATTAGAVPAPAGPAAIPDPAIAPPGEGLLRMRSLVAATCAIDGGVSLGVGETWFEQRLAKGKHRLECACPGYVPWSLQLDVGADPLELVLPFTPATVTAAPAPAAEADFVLPPDASAQPPAAPVASAPAPPEPRAPVVPAPAAAVSDALGAAAIEIRVEGREWTCRIDGQKALSPDAARPIVVEVGPGTHRIACERPGAEPAVEVVSLRRGERHVMNAKFVPKRDAPPAPATPAKPPITGPAEGTEWSVSGGFGPALGSFGVGVGVRSGAWAGSIGSGVYPLSFAATRYATPGASGWYFTAGYVRLARGLLGGGSNVEGHGLFGGAGMEIRVEQSLAVRIGAGLGWNSTGLQSGPLTFDLSAVFLP